MYHQVGFHPREPEGYNRQGEDVALPHHVEEQGQGRKGMELDRKKARGHLAHHTP